MKKVYIKTFGCQMNYHDTQRILANLQEISFEQTQDQNDADVILFNTCSVRDLANQKFYSYLGETIKLKEKKDVKVIACGCVVQTEGKSLLEKYPQLDAVFGTDSLDQVSDIVFKLNKGEKKILSNKFESKKDDYSIETKIVQHSPQAFVNIIKGCDKFCSYCIVPFTRGREKSRSIEEVYKDIQNLAKYSGVQEVTLLGQNVNSFGKERGESLAQLLFKLENISELKLIRYTTSHPYDLSDELIQAHKECKKLSVHLHLPVQSGSNTVLQRMLRQYSVEHYLRLLDKIRYAQPNIVISSDIIAGFPNESRAEHEETLSFLDHAQFDFIYAYAFSKRAGTKAERIRDVLNQDIRKQRLYEIQEKQYAIQSVIRKKLINQQMNVLVVGKDKTGNKWQGKTNCSRTINIVSDEDLQWKWVNVRVVNATTFSLEGLPC